MPLIKKPDPRDAAAYWFARAHSGNFTPEEAQALSHWRQESAAHEQEYLALDEIWQVAGLAPEDDMRELLVAAPSVSRERHSPIRRRLVLGGLTAGVAAVAISTYMTVDWFETPVYTSRFETRKGEQRTESLPDGSVLELNTESVVTVRYYSKRRSVELTSGEVMFNVSAQAGRPFIVDAQVGTVYVTGTRFNVRRAGDQVSVAVASGTVDVISGHWWSRHKESLTAGLGTRMSANGITPAIKVDVASVTAWRAGKIVFEDLPLQDVVAEMNRYLSPPIQIVDDRLRGMRLNGVFTLRDPAAFLTALSRSMPIAVTTRSDGGANLGPSR